MGGFAAPQLMRDTTVQLSCNPLGYGYGYGYLPHVTYYRIADRAIRSSEGESPEPSHHLSRGTSLQSS